ncbi:hypothetical protein LF1_18260 [Rubripirellula obstinata]|uniref:Uncharacterized protein n=1 Tax=Rubripirellula obstinata TaxID=406547 RepID=A0A5B1CFI2_9BACT|nr:hypothetical protein LF1_18260 [Rubripirellula obstinata]
MCARILTSPSSKNEIGGGHFKGNSLFDAGGLTLLGCEVISFFTVNLNLNFRRES